MKELYVILSKCINSNKIDIITNLILNNYKKILELKNLSNNFNLDKYKLQIFSKNDYSSTNIVLMFRLLEKKFYKKLEVDMHLKYKNELFNNNSDNKYMIITTDNEKKLNIFKSYLIIYYLNLKLNEKESYLGLDFEFNTKKVALMQINFEQVNLDLFNTSLIFIFDPIQLSKNWKLFFVQKILCNLKCYKILHGSDSLDIPYVYSILLEGSNKNIIKFTEMFIDTKYLCEYKYYSEGQNLGKCKIYHILKMYEVITESKYNELLENENNMGPIYDIIININNLSEPLIKYTLYDVLFLKHLVDKIKYYIIDYNLINKITQYIFLEKRGITKNIPYEEVNKINNYIIIISNKTYRLNDIFKKKFNKILSTNKKIYNILKINYFKSTLIYLLKFIFYKNICVNYTVYSKIAHSKILYDNIILDYKLEFPGLLSKIIDELNLNKIFF